MAAPPAETAGQLTGVLAFPLTAFDSELELDLEGTAAGIERQVAAGASAVFIACGTGELSSLTFEEQRALWRRAVEVVDGRVPVWVGAGGGAGQARAAYRAAADSYVDGALLLPPYLVTGPERGIGDYVRYVTGTGALQTVVYHRATAVLSPAAATDLLDVPAVIGIKDGYGSIELMSRIVTAVRSSGHPRAQDFLFFNGLPTAEMSARAYAAIDVARYSSAVHCFAPELAQAFHDALLGGDEDAVDLLLARFYLPLVALRDECPGFAVSLVKAGAALRGHPMGAVRPPLVMPDAIQVERLAAILAAGDGAMQELAAR
ncbi:5-dehydro-4-deoxyglucarate dehydratase [Flexivirga caeni]|uniref:5-dehydro-4-deoxyglucarate dehydratase n=1 Tax=Flexivirga caeni TaxID=2294115 RepID=A0A3M9LYA7_9MICO|nr:5-dehydro-4-deoxyglucarate dehydratase [Flexivirga caeni]RNI18276.1 5-dehydro-4-deoxyglucarate dehydratase [Flexivirga caeni]